jgi:hypothetical protein
MYREKEDGLTGNDQQIIRYLLHEAGEEELSMMEERLLSDASFFDLVACIEDEMIMQYVRGEMEPDLKQRFEKNYLVSPERRARIESARQLRTAVHSVAATRAIEKSKKRTFFPLPMRIACAAAALAVAVWWVWWKAPATQTRTGVAEVAMSVALQPARTRSGEGNAGAQFAIAADIQEVHFLLAEKQVQADQHYQVILGTPERPGIFSGAARIENGTVAVTVPAKLLIPGDYTLELQSIAADGRKQLLTTYYFRVNN